MLSILIDPARLGGADTYAAETERVVDWVRSTRAEEGVGAVRIPGEPERDMRARRGAEGIPLDPTSWADIVASALSLGLERSRITGLSGVLI